MLGTVVVYTCGPGLIINGVHHVFKSRIPVPADKSVKRVGNRKLALPKEMGEALWTVEPEEQGQGTGSLSANL